MGLPLILGAAALGGAAGYFGSQGKTKVDPYGTLNPEQRQINAALGPAILGNLNKDYTYTGQLNAPIGQGEQDVVNQNARMNAIAGNTYGTFANYNDPNFNSQFNQEIADPTFANFQNNIAPYLAQELPSFGTQRANVIARSLGDLQNNVLQQRFTARESAKNRALQAANDSAGYFQTAAGIQSIPRSIQQAGLDRDYQNFIQANQQKSDSLSQALAFLGLSTGTAQYKPNSTGQALQGALAGASAFAGSMGSGSSSPSSVAAQHANTPGLTFGGEYTPSNTAMWR